MNVEAFSTEDKVCNKIFKLTQSLMAIDDPQSKHPQLKEQNIIHLVLCKI